TVSARDRRQPVRLFFSVRADSFERLPERLDQPLAQLAATAVQLGDPTEQHGRLPQRPHPDPRRLAACLPSYAGQVVRQGAQRPQSLVAALARLPELHPNLAQLPLPLHHPLREPCDHPVQLTDPLLASADRLIHLAAAVADERSGEASPSAHRALGVAHPRGATLGSLADGTPQPVSRSSATARARLGLELEPRRLPPQDIQAVALSQLRHEHMQDAVQVVHQHPVRSSLPLHRGGQHAVVLLQPLMDLFVDRLRQAFVARRADHQKVRVRDQAPHVERHHILRLLRVGHRGQTSCQRLGGELIPVRVRHRAHARYRPRSTISSITASGTRWRIGRPAATRWRTSLEDTPISGISTTSARPGSPRRSSAAFASSSTAPGREAIPRRASSRIRCGSRQASKLAATSAPIRKTNSSRGRASLNSSSVRTENDGPSRLVSTSEASSPGSVSAASRAISSRSALPGSGSILLCGASPVGTSRTSLNPSWNAASCPSTRCPMCGGLNAPPRTPMAATAPPTPVRAAGSSPN